MPCYGLNQDLRNHECKACPHSDGCHENMGMRAGRVTLDRLVFDLIPIGLSKGPVANFDPERDINALYQSTYRLVYGSNPVQTVGKFTRAILSLSRQAEVNVANFMLISMVGHQLAWPDKEFKASHLVDNRALHRVNTYAQACKERFGVVDAAALDALTGQNNAQFGLRARMLEAEVTVGKWIIEWKLDNEGPPYEPLFYALELELDVNWLAIEPRFEPRMIRNLDRANATANSHDIADKVRVLKKYKHESYANFVYRQMIMPEAVRQVLGEFGFQTCDFERENKPVVDALLFWHRLALALQHLECLKWIDCGTGYYAST